MKTIYSNLKSTGLILSVIAILMAIIFGSAQAQTTQTNYLKLKGKVLDGYLTNIQVFEQSDINSWKKVSTKKNRSRYSLRLNPESNYRIYFTSNEGHLKVLYVDGGIPGMWISELDINFYMKNIKYARLYQVPKTSTYAVAVVHKDMSGSKIVIHRKDDKGIAQTNTGQSD